MILSAPYHYTVDEMSCFRVSFVIVRVLESINVSHSLATSAASDPSSGDKYRKINTLNVLIPLYESYLCKVSHSSRMATAGMIHSDFKRSFHASER